MFLQNYSTEDWFAEHAFFISASLYHRHVRKWGRYQVRALFLELRVEEEVLFEPKMVHELYLKVEKRLSERWTLMSC